MEDTEKVDVAVIGAGLSGIAFARFYLDSNPSCRLTILEKDGCIGGVWSTTRVFDAFWAQSPLRMTSFSDVPLQIPKDAPRSYDTFEAKYVTHYLEEYVDSHMYGGKSLRTRIRLNEDVRSVEKVKNEWILGIGGNVHQSIRCAKLAIASGLTSTPNIPSFPRCHRWTAPILHHRDFGRKSKAILAVTSPYQNITVLGGGKSAADMVYAAVKAGKNVNWVIRKSGEGPGIFMNPAATGRYKHNAEGGTTQKATDLNPSSFRSMPEWARIMHQSESERENLESKLFAADRRYKAWANYKGRKSALPGFRDLEPRASFFWNSGPVGLIQQEDFWDLICQNVNVYNSDISCTLDNSIILDDGRKAPTDILLCGTGWKPDYPFLSSHLVFQLGLPHDPDKDTEEEKETWNNLMSEADRQITKEFPILTRPPSDCKPIGAVNHTPARLYQGIASLNDGSIVFLGRARVSNNFLGAEAQAIWATAFLDGHIVMPPKKQAQREVAYMNAFSRRRYPSHGVDGINFHTDLIWYTDSLVHEAGLTSHRKGWWQDPEEPLLACDFRDCKDEYTTKYKSQLAG